MLPTSEFTECLKRLAAIPEEATAARSCTCGAEVWMFTGRRSGYIWVRHGNGPRPCAREGFEVRLEPGTPEPFVAYEELAPEILHIVSNDVGKNEWDF